MPHVFLKTCRIWRRNLPRFLPRPSPPFAPVPYSLSSHHRIHRKALPARRGRCLRSVFETQARPQGPAENGFPLVCKMAGRACEAHMRNGDWPAERRVFRGATAKAVNATLYQKGAVTPAEKPELQVKTTETGHIACHFYLLNQAHDVSRPIPPVASARRDHIRPNATGVTRRVKALSYLNGKPPQKSVGSRRGDLI